MNMPQPASLFEMPPDEAAEARAEERARAELQAGKGVSHARVREWLRRLAEGKSVPPPSE